MAKIVLSKDGQSFHLYCGFKEKDKAKKAGCRWNPSKKTWDFAFDLKNLENILDVFDDEVDFPDNMVELIQSKKKELKEIDSIKSDAKDNVPTEYAVEGLSFGEIKNPLYNYQRHGCRYGSVAEGGFLIADEMGLGKSLQGLGISLIKKKRGAKRTLIVCPASLKYNWLDEINKFTDEEAIVVEGSVEQRFERWFDDSTYFKIVNYEIFTRDLYYEKKEKIVNGKKTYNKDNRIPNSDEILDNYFDIAVVDEVHYLKSYKSNRTKALRKLKVETKVGLTGTPIDGKLEELHCIFDFLKPGLFPSRGKFLEAHAKKDYFGGIECYINVDKVREKIDPYYIRRLKKKVLQDLPDKIFQDVYIELDKKALKEYKLLAKRKHEITEEKEAIVAAIRCRQFCNFPEVLDIDLPSRKFEKLQEILENIVEDNGNKVILFSQYTETTDILVEELEKKYGVLYIHGGVSSKKRVEMCKKFNSDGKIDIIVMTDAGAVGLNLQRASYVIMYDDNYSPAIMQQRWDRAHRIGQKNTVNVIRFITKDTIEERVRGIFDKKLELNSQLLDEDYTEISLGNLTSKELLKLL